MLNADRCNRLLANKRLRKKIHGVAVISNRHSYRQKACEVLLPWGERFRAIIEAPENVSEALRPVDVAEQRGLDPAVSVPVTSRSRPIGAQADRGLRPSPGEGCAAGSHSGTLLIQAISRGVKTKRTITTIRDQGWYRRITVPRIIAGNPNIRMGQRPYRRSIIAPSGS